jgi:pilus assembly protein CpaB
MKPARIIVLVIALAAGGIAAFLASRPDHEPPPPQPVAQIETVDVLVAATDIGVGTALSSGDMRWQPWPTAAASANFVRRTDRADAIEQFTGSVTRASFSAGEPIREGRLIKAKGSGYMAAILPEGMRAVATDIIPETSAGGFILPNDHVDVILSRRDKDAEKATGSEAVFVSEIVISNVRVLAIDQTVEEKSGQRVIIGKTATLELTPNQSEIFTRAKQMGNVTLALRSIADFEGKDAPEVDNKPQSRTGINMVRFGVTLPAVTPK